MDRRQVRREVLRQVGYLEEIRDKLEKIAEDADQAGDPILCGELRRYLERLTDWLDQMYVWASNI